MENIPVEVLYHIFRYISTYELCEVVSKVCKRWNLVIMRHAMNIKDANELELFHEGLGAVMVSDPVCNLYQASKLISFATQMIPRLKELTICRCFPLDDDDYKSLVCLPHLKHLDVFSKSQWMTGHTTINPSITTLVVNETIGDDFLQNLSKRKKLSGFHMYGRALFYRDIEMYNFLQAHTVTLQELTLRCFSFSDDWFEIISQCVGLVSLRLYQCAMLTPRCIAGIASLSKLRCLHLTGARLFRSLGMLELINSLPLLIEDLNLSNSDFGNEHCTALAQRLPRLAVLELWGCGPPPNRPSRCDVWVCMKPPLGAELGRGAGRGRCAAVRISVDIGRNEWPGGGPVGIELCPWPGAGGGAGLGRRPRPGRGPWPGEGPGMELLRGPWPGEGGGAGLGRRPWPGEGPGMELVRGPWPGEAAGMELVRGPRPGEGGGAGFGRGPWPVEGGDMRLVRGPRPREGADMERVRGPRPGDDGGAGLARGAWPGEGAGIELGRGPWPGEGGGAGLGRGPWPGVGAGMELLRGPWPGEGRGAGLGRGPWPGMGAGMELVRGPWPAEGGGARLGGGPWPGEGRGAGLGRGPWPADGGDMRLVRGPRPGEGAGARLSLPRLAQQLPHLRALDTDVVLDVEQLRTLAKHPTLRRLRCLWNGRTQMVRSKLIITSAVNECPRMYLREDGVCPSDHLFYYWTRGVDLQLLKVT